MRILIVTNLYPWPGQPTRGMYNAQTVRELSHLHAVAVCVLVPEWRVWRWGAIRRWQSPERCVEVAYLPVFYLPVIGRSLNHLTYRWSLCRAPQGGHTLRAADGDTPSLPKTRTRRCAFQGGATLSDTIKGYDAVLVPWLYPDGAAVAEIACRLGKPVWLMALGSDTFRLHGGARHAILKACSQARGIVCVCRLLADRLAAAGIPGGKIHIVPNGVDTSLFRCRRKEEVVGRLSSDTGGLFSTNNPSPISNNRPASGGTILFVGNLVPVKGPDVMLRAFTELGKNEVRVAADVPAADGQSSREVVPRDVERHREVTLPQLLLIGSGPMRAQLERLAKDLNISNRVHFLGNRPHEEVALWMNVADVLCLTSRSEGMPNVVLEARASGLPVVATPAGACTELRLDRENFIVTKSFSVMDVAAGLRDMLGREPTLREADRGVSTWRQEAEGIAALIQTGQAGGC